MDNFDLGVVGVVVLVDTCSRASSQGSYCLNEAGSVDDERQLITSTLVLWLTPGWTPFEAMH